MTEFCRRSLHRGRRRMIDIGPLDIRRHVEALTVLGPRDPESGSAVAGALRYLTDQLKGFGYEVSVERYGGDLHEVNLLDIDIDLADVVPVAEVVGHLATLRREGSPS